MATEPDRISIYELNHPPEEQDPRLNRTDEQIQRLKDRLKEKGWLSPIKFTSEDLLIVDGNTRVHALKELDEDGDYEYLYILGEFQGFTYALPDIDLDLDAEEAPAELNIHRKNLTDADRTTYLEWLINHRVKDNSDFHVARDVNTTELLSQLEDDREWEYSDEAKTEIEEILSLMDFESAEAARNHISLYNRAPESVQELWVLDEINYSHFEELTRIYERLEDDAELADTSARAGHGFEDLVEYSKEDDYRGKEEYYTRTELREIVDDLEEEEEPEPDDEPEDVDENKFETFKCETLTAKDREQAEQIADYEEGLSTEEVLKECYQMHKKGDDFRQDLTTAVEEIEELEREMDERKAKRRQALNDFGFATDSRFADGEANHLAPPIETENYGVFFHDVQEMDDEVDDGELQLIFTSPPYFTQSDRIVERWWPEDVEYTEDNITESTVDNAYQNYLDEMKEIFQLLHAKLEQGRYLILNISDTKAYGLETKGYDIPSDLSHLIRHEVNQNYEPENQFKYDATIAWDKGEGQTHDRNQSFFADGKPLAYHPNWRYERLLVFRKGKRDHPDTDFRLNTSQFQPYSDDVWRVNNKTQASDHEAGFTVELPKKIIQLYSCPGDTIADVFGGYSTTLFAAKALNEEVYPDEPDWTGYAWENFASETAEQEDYRERIDQLLNGQLAQFRSGYLDSSSLS